MKETTTTTINNKEWQNFSRQDFIKLWKLSIDDRIKSFDETLNDRDVKALVKYYHELGSRLYSLCKEEREAISLSNQALCPHCNKEEYQELESHIQDFEDIATEYNEYAMEVKQWNTQRNKKGA